MRTVAGYIEKIIYRNNDSGFSILSVSSGKTDLILTGTFSTIDEGEYIEAEVTERNHPTYGEQYNVSSYAVKAPEDLKGIERYLASGAVKGVREALAARIVKKFKADTLRIIEEEPERLVSIKGISERMARSICEQILEKKEMRDAMIFLQKYGISMNLSAKIYKFYGSKIYSVIAQNPYRIADDIPGVGFKIADDIAKKAGIHVDSEFRIKSGIIYALEQATLSGHTYLPKEELQKNASDILGVSEEMILDVIPDLQMERRIIVKTKQERVDIYINRLYYLESYMARQLHELNIHSDMDKEPVRSEVRDIERREGIELDENQRNAVVEAVTSGLLVITGGPGTGKTTTINTMIRYFLGKRMEILLAAPTGRAAKRMTESSGMEARTIHRLLEINGAPSDEGITGDQASIVFGRNEDNPLEADVIIIDEMSMVDVHLMSSLLKAVPQGTRLVLVGDTNQLPSVGPGNVLRDIIDSEHFKVVKLDHIYRQAAKSDIIVNAHKMIRGEKIDLQKKSLDFLFVQRMEADQIIAAMLTLITKKLPDYVHADALDIQVMSPMRKGNLGVERLNSVLQASLNPPASGKKEKEYNGIVFREGDKVMQIKNNYQMEWEQRNSYGFCVESGLGVFNGDIGKIIDINFFAESLSVEFDEGRIAEYQFQELEELEHAYAITIHKSQGSEYPAVVLPLYFGPRLLMTRNLIYTAVTRARKCVTMVGMGECFEAMVNNDSEQKRYSGLKDRIEELAL